MGGNKVKNDHGGGDELVSLLFIYCCLTSFIVLSVLFYSILFHSISSTVLFCPAMFRYVPFIKRCNQ